MPALLAALWSLLPCPALAPLGARANALAAELAGLPPGPRRDQLAQVHHRARAALLRADGCRAEGYDACTREAAAEAAALLGALPWPAGEGRDPLPRLEAP